MKKTNLRVLGIIFVLCSFLCLFSLSASAAEKVTSGDFVFSVGKSSATLLEYTGNDSSVKIPTKINKKKVTAIADYAFWQKKSMKSVTIPDTVKKIGEAAFNECTSLKKVVLPEHLTTLKDAVFWYCTNLKTVVIKENAKSFGDNVFRGCKNVTVYVYKGSKAETFVKSQSDLKYGYMEITSLKTTKTLSVALGSKAKMSVTVKPSVVYNSKLKFKTSDSKIATVSSKGVITPKKCGTCVISATTTDGTKKTVKTTVTVTPAMIEKITQSKVKATSFKLSWTASEGATKYAVYKYNAKTKKWARTNTSKTALTFSSLELGSTTKFKIKAYVKVGKENIYSPTSKTFSFSVLKPGVVSTPKFVSSTTDSVSISWAKASNASGYEIYRYNDSSKALSYVGSTTGLSYTVSNLSPNTQYRFVVKAFLKYSGKKYLCPTHSEPNYTATKPSVPTGLKTTDDDITAKSILLSWNKLNGAHGYEIAYCKTGSDFKTVKISSGSATSYLFDDLENGASYTFRIRAVGVHFSKTFFSDYSSDYTVKTKALPTNNTEAVNYFSTALEKTSLVKNGYSLFVTPQSAEVTANISSEKTALICDEIEASLATGKKYYTFSDGVNQNGLSLAEVISPEKKSLAFSSENIVAESADYSLNGSGFDLSFEMKDKTACHFTPSVDFVSICENGGYSLQGVSYTTKVLDLTKVNNGLLDLLEVSVDFNAIITVDGEDVVFSGSYSYLYVFAW